MVESECVLCGVVVKRNGFKAARYCSMACKAEAQRRQKPVQRDWLYQKYVVEGLGAPEIAALVHRHPKRVWEWLRDVGIPTRPRGTDPRVQFKPGASGAFLGHRHTPENRERIRQARLRDGHVPYLKNGVHYLKGKRGGDTPNWKGGVTSERHLFYSTAAWKAAVKSVWARDNGICQRCHVDYRAVYRQGIRFSIHHIVDFSHKEVRCEIGNLALLCWPCHLFVHSKANIGKEFLP